MQSAGEVIAAVAAEEDDRAAEAEEDARAAEAAAGGVERKMPYPASLSGCLQRGSVRKRSCGWKLPHR